MPSSSTIAVDAAAALRQATVADAFNVAETAAPGADDVQIAHAALPPAPAPAAAAAAPGNASGAPRLSAPQLNCQAAVVRIGDMFGEFSCSVFRVGAGSNACGANNPSLHTSRAAASSRAFYKRGGASMPSPAAATLTEMAANCQHDSQHEGAAAAAADAIATRDVPLGTTSTVAAVDGSATADVGFPVNCEAEGVPRWELLIYAVLHEEQGGGAGAAASSGARNRYRGEHTSAAPQLPGDASTAADGSSEDGGDDECPLPDGAKLYFQQTMPTTKLSKVVKLEAGRRYTVRVRCYSRADVRWSAWSAPIQTATLFPVETRLGEIGSDYVHCTWDRSAQRNEDGLAHETDAATTEWARSIPDFELRLLRESDMAEHYHGTFEAGCRSATIRDLQSGTRYIVLMRYRTVIRTMREWTEATRLITESALEVRLIARGEDIFTFSWAREAQEGAAKAPASKRTSTTVANDPLFDEARDDDAAVAAFGYLQPRTAVHEYELTIESPGLRFDPITVPASVCQYTMTDMFPSTTYSVCVRALSAEGRWSGRSAPLKLRTAIRPVVSVAVIGESFASFMWSRKGGEEPHESQLQYRVQSMTSAYHQAETVDLAPSSSPTGHPRRLLHIEHLRSGSDYTVSLRIAIEGTWGIWTEPQRFTTAPSLALTFLERGEDFLTLNWPSADLAAELREDDTNGAAAETLPVYNIVVVKVDDLGERTVVLNERVTRDPSQRGFRVNDLEADTTYDVQCRAWQHNPLTGFEDWGEMSTPVRMRTLQAVALHVWDVGEDFIHIIWRRGLSEASTGPAETASATGDNAAAAAAEWDHLRYEVVMGCVETGEDAILHRHVLDTSYTFTQLKPSTTYTIAVRACDEHGQWGLWSRAKVRTPASMKTTIHEIGEDFVRLVWQRCAARDDADLSGVTVADMFVAKYSILVYGRELPGMPVMPHTQSGYEAGGGRSDIARFEVVSSEHTSLRVGDLLPDREYVAVVRAATSSGRWGLWSRPVRFRTNPQFRIPTHQLTIGENYVKVVWGRGEAEASRLAPAERDDNSEDGEVHLGDWSITGQELRISGVTTQYARQYALGADVRELKVCDLLPASAYTIQIRVRGRSGSWGLWSSPVPILTRGTIAVTTDEVAEDFITVRWERRKVANPHQYPTGHGVVTSYHLRVYNAYEVHTETFLGDGDCPYRVTGLKANTYYCVELKANYNDEEWGLWSVPLWCLTMQPMRIHAKLISEEFCCLQLRRPNQQRRLPEDDDNPPTEDRVLAHGRLRPMILLCVTAPALSKAPYHSAAVAPEQSKAALLNDALPPDATHQRLIYQTELLSSAETVEYTVPNLKCNTVYSVSVRTKLANGEWGMWSPSLVFATVPAMRISFTTIGESFVSVEWVRHSQVVPPQIANPEQVVFGVATITASRVRVRESGGAYQHTYTVEGATSSLRIDHLTPATTYMVCVQTFNDNYEWGVWSEEQKVRTVPGMDIHVQHVSEDALWVSWSRRTDLDVAGDANTVFNVNISARAYEVCLIGEGGFTYRQETDSTSLFFRGLMPDAVYTIYVRALFVQSEYWGLWSAQAFRTKPRMRVTFGNIGEHFVMLEWRRHLPKPTDAEVRLLLEDDSNADVAHGSDELQQNGVLPPLSDGEFGRSAVTALARAVATRQRFSIAETEDVVQLYRFKVQRVGEAHSLIYNIAPTVSGFCLHDLQPSSEYRVWVCAKGHEGVWGFWSEDSRVRTLPRLRLEVLNIGEDYVRAEWRRGAWEGACMADGDGAEVRQVDGAVSGYEIRVLDGASTVAATTTTTFRETAATLSGLRLSTLYTIQVRAKDTYDAWGLWSDPVPFYTLKPVGVRLQRVGETFVDAQWSRQMHRLHPQHAHDEVAEAGSDVAGMQMDEKGVLHPDERVTRWHLRVSCNRVFAGMPQTDDYRELYTEEGEQALRIDGLLPHATYSIAVRGLNNGGDWGHWSPAAEVTTCPLLKVGVEVAGETFLQLAWRRPATRSGLATTTAVDQHDDKGSADVSVPGSDGGVDDSTHSEVQLVENTSHVLSTAVSHAGASHGENGDDEGEYSALPFFHSTPLGTYLCFPSDSGVHNFQVTIRPMPTELAFDETDEPLVDGARVYETTQPALRLGNLLPGTRYAISVREQQVDEEGCLVAGEWGAPSEVVCTQTVPPMQVTTQEIGEDYCMVEWRRAAEAPAADNFAHGAPSMSAEGRTTAAAAMLTTAAWTMACYKSVEFELQTRRLNMDGTSLRDDPLALDSVVSLPSSVSTHHISGLVPSSVYEVRVRAKIENAHWGMWSPATRFVTQSRVELHVDQVQEVAVLVSWCRPRATHTRSGTINHVQAEKREWCLATGSAENQEDLDNEDAAEEQVELSGSEVARPATTAGIFGSQVIQADYAVHEYELILEGISVDERRRLTFTQETQSTLIEDLQQDQLYCLSIRSLSEKQHWSRFSTKVTVLTLACVQVQVAQRTECTARLEWFRPQPDVGKFTELLARHQRDALHQCDDRERRELLEMKRKIQEQESKGEPTTAVAGWTNPVTREEHNTLLREEATRHYQAEHIVVGDADCTGYELLVTLQKGEVCLPFIAAIETLRRCRPGGVATAASTREGMMAAKRSVHAGSMMNGGNRGFASAGNGSFHDCRRHELVKTPTSPDAAPTGSLPASTDSVTLLNVQLRSCVSQVLLQGLSPDAVFSAQVRARGVPDSWQPWSRPAVIETLPLLQLDQSRFGEHYINLYWYRGDPGTMDAVSQEAEEFRRLQREFHNFTERGLEEQRSVLGAAAYASLVNRLRRLRMLRRLSAARAKQHADGEMGLLVDPSCPVQGFQLRVIDEVGTISENYLPNNQYHDLTAPPTLSFTATGLHPNSLYVCCLCPYYGDDVWGCWTAPLKFMTHHIIQLEMTYISETFVDLQWWRLDNKPTSPLDEHDTLLSSRYTEEVQVYQLRITHEDAVTGQEVEEFRNMRACNVLRIDALLPDMKYTIAVREWDPKGDWGLWSAACSCVTLPSIETTVTDVKESSARVSWRRMTPRIDYENDMHVLEDNSEITGFYLRLEEVPLRTNSAAVSPTVRATSAHRSSSPTGVSDPCSDGVEVLSMSMGDVGMPNNSFHDATGTPLEEKPRAAEADELEGTLAFGFQRGGPLPPEAHPQLHDGLVPDSVDDSGEAARLSHGQCQHYLLVKRITSSTELESHLSDLHPQTVYRVQVMAETTGGQVGPWSPPHFFITTPQLRLSADLIDEHYVSLQWGRRPLAPLAAQIGGRGVTSTSGVAGFFSESNTFESMEGGGNAAAAAGVLVTLPTSKVLHYELEVRGGAGTDFAFCTRIESAAASGAFRVTGLAMDSVYVARVRSFSDAGEASFWSPVLTFVTLRQLVVHPQEITENTIEMNWARPEQIPQQYLACAAFETAAGMETNAALAAVPAMSEASASVTTLVLQSAPAAMRSHRVVCVGDREAVKYQVRVYHATEQTAPRMLMDKHLNGNVTKFLVHSLAPNSVYLLYVRAINCDGVWSEWSEGRCVYTMKPLVSSIATVGEDFVRVRWSREAPEELHYTLSTANTATAAGGHRRSVAAAATDADGEGEEDEATEHVERPLPDDADTDAQAISPNKPSTDSPDVSRMWQHERRFRLHDQPAEVGVVYCSALTSIQSFTISVRRSDEAEGCTVEVPGHVSKHTLPALQPDCVYLICVQAQYRSGERGPWSDVVLSGTYNLLAMDVKEVGEDYVSASWQRKPNTIHMASLQIGQVEETVCYEVRIRDYTDVPLGEEEGGAAQHRDSEGRSVFLHANQRHSILRELLSNHRYRLSVRRWYRPRDGFAKTAMTTAPATSTSTTRSSVSNALEGHRSVGEDNDQDGAGDEEQKRTTEEVEEMPLLPAAPTVLQLYEQTTHTVMDAALRESMEKAKAAPGVWSDSEYVVTLRDMVCSVERVGEEYFQLLWARDPRAIPLPVRRAMPVKPVQNYQLRIDELLRNGSGVETSRGSNTLHLDELMAPTETSYFNKALKPNTLYKVEVRCCIEKMWGRWSRPVYIITQPCLQVEVSRIGEECATIAWHRPREGLTLPDGEVAVIGDEEEVDGSYQLELSGVCFNYQISKRFKASRTSYTVKHLDADALYSVRVRSGDGINQACSLWSATTCFATLKPIQVVVSMPTEQFVHVEWRRPTQTAEEYAERLEQQAGPAAAPSLTLAANAAAVQSQQQQDSGEGTRSESVSPTGSAPHPSGAVQLGNPGSLAFHLCVFNTQKTPSVAVVDKQFHKDVSHYRVGGLVADTPYAIIVRACCEATNDWGLWSEERTFRTLKLLAPTVSSAGETYAELTWERSESDSRGAGGGSVGSPSAALGAPTLPTKYLLVIRSTQAGILEREISAEECRNTATPMQEGYLDSSYRLTQLQPGTEYVVALQPCYGGGDWGLWSQAATFTTLYPVKLTAKITKDTVDLSWGRCRPSSAVGFVEDVDFTEAGTVGPCSGNSTGVSQEPAAAGTMPAGSRSVSRYQLVVYSEADMAALHSCASSMEGSLAQQHFSSLLFFPSTAPSQEGRPGERSAAAAPHQRSSLKHRQRQEGAAIHTAARLHSSLSGSLDSLTNAAQTTIPDMDVAALANLDGGKALPSPSKESLFLKQYDLTDAAVSAALHSPHLQGNSPRGGTSALAGTWSSTSSMHERIEGLTPDTTYVARLRAMDLFGNWGTPVEVRFVTPPPAPTQVVLRRVNAQFCSLQWSTPEGAAAETESAAPRGSYRYVIEQCFVQTDRPLSAGTTIIGGGGGGGGASARKAGGAGASSGPVATLAAAGWHVIDTVEDTNVCAVLISGLLSRMRCRVKCARRIAAASAHDAGSGAVTAVPVPDDHLGPYSDYSEAVAVSSGTPPEGVVDLHLTTLSQNAATLEWLPPPKPSEAAAGRYTRPVYRIYLANTTDQPYPVLLATVHRPTYVLTNLTPSTTYTVQIVAENPDGVSFLNPILRFHTKSEEDQTVSRRGEGGDTSGGAAEQAAPLAELVPFHGLRAALTDDGPAAVDGGADVADIPTAVRRSLLLPTLPASHRRRGGRGGAAGRAPRSSSKRKAISGSGHAKTRGSSGATGRGAGKHKSRTRRRSSSAVGSKRLSNAAPETTREAPPTAGSFLPQLAKTL
ncbi:Fibronectin type III domain containing protein [Leishmania donovani]|uniref:Fibronectin_type_III_domain_containing_protein_pu tative/Pfam:PF00041 n=1 Tax=Leishmania donovani TaxID=5661 RepID=A0A6J8FDR7_LEIDO|nr:Fibronectin type III domain containing protein [Leishmania donovani]VDZ45693.1 Fibronectin_type_III_domain_containing_protein_putative/Pfam:PF00041 [Leishmania donovani]